jgi:hypothetical protein
MLIFLELVAYRCTYFTWVVRLMDIPCDFKHMKYYEQERHPSIT